jgi:hypothetical protein
VPSDPWVNPEKPTTDGGDHEDGESTEHDLDDARANGEAGNESVQDDRRPDEIRAGSDDLA